MITLGGADTVSIEFIARTRLFVAPGIVDQERVRRFISERYFGNGSVRFDEHSLLWRDFRTVANIDWEYEIVKVTIDYFVQRVRNYAHLETLAAAGFEEATVVSHGDDCDRDGERIDVAQEIERLRSQLQLSPAEYEKNSYGRGSGIPPFTPKCTCRLGGHFG